MRISFFGAAREVTGSCYFVETSGTRILVDCGAFQGSAFVEARNFQPFGFDPKTIDAVFITHAHLDHVGRLPKLIKDGFKGKIYLTPPTADLTKIVLEDAFHIMRDEHRRQYRPMLYESQDIQDTLTRFKALDYDRVMKLGNLSINLEDAGHIFGSAFIRISEQGNGTAVFSGDVGNQHVPILRETVALPETDVLITESTYGNRVHEDESTRETKLRDMVIKTIRQKGALVIPAFAIERTQQLLYELHDLMEKKFIPSVPVYLDSPMAIQTADVIERYPQYYDEDATAHVLKGENFMDFSSLKLCRTRDESKLINEAPKPKIIIAGAGMMNGGRIQHHLLRYLGDPASTVLIIGYQAKHTLGHQLYEGKKMVEVLGERINVKATILSIGAYSAHADQTKLVNWVLNATHKPSHIYCTHGEEGAAIALATRMTQKTNIPADVPRFGDTITL
ncbi:MBL fold metallo-hydrolase [Candidatus Uhrbacteria bacterium]|nr:MBL fold metallo-hydrolase [Candidatus Uhrbacteria bacterium]